MIVMGGEFGRTPKISLLPEHYRAPGRDHWGAAQTLFFAGGGIAGVVALWPRAAAVAGRLRDRGDHRGQRPFVAAWEGAGKKLVYWLLKIS